MTIIGCRWWYAAHRTGTGWRLRSVFHDEWWDGPRLTAAAAPARENSSGIHAFENWDLAVAAARTLNAFPRDGSYPVVGEVALWGKVVEHEHGFRAEHALVRRLQVPEHILARARSPQSSGEVCGFALLDGGLMSPPLPSRRLGCCLVRDEDKGVGRRDHVNRIPDPRMAPALARLYGVDAELGPAVEW